MSVNYPIRAVEAVRIVLQVLGRHSVFAIMVNDGGGLVIGTSQGLERGQEEQLRRLANPANQTTQMVIGGVPVCINGQRIALYPMTWGDGEHERVVGALTLYPVNTIEDARDEMLRLAEAFGMILGDAIAHQELRDEIAVAQIRSGDVPTCKR